jgi:hypothetical protein
MAAILFLLLFLLGLAVAIGSAFIALQKRKLLWYILSVLFPCLYALLALSAVDLVQERRLDFLGAAVFAIVFVSLGWGQAWLETTARRKAKLSELAELEQLISAGQLHIEEWRRAVLEADRDGVDSKEERTFLKNVQRSQAERIARRNSLFEEIGKRAAIQP